MSTLSYSTFEKNDNDDSKTERKRKNRTIKKKSKKVENFLNGLSSMDENGDDDSGLANFNEFPPQPQLTRQPDKVKENSSSTDNAVSPEGFSKMESDEAANLNYQNYC